MFHQHCTSPIFLLGNTEAESLDNAMIWEDFMPRHAQIKFHEDVMAMFETLHGDSEDVVLIDEPPPFVSVSGSCSSSYTTEEDSNNEDENDEGDDDETYGDDDDTYGDETRPSPKRRRRMRAPPPSPATRALASSGLHDDGKDNAIARFLAYYKKSVRMCECVDEGTFSVQPPLTLQYLSQTQPLPNLLTCRFKMFGEMWRSKIEYTLSADGDTLLKFSILHMESGVETFLVETAKEADVRRNSQMPRTICNRIFLLALKRCKTYLSARLASADGGAVSCQSATLRERLTCLSASKSSRKCTESISLFGLRSDFMKNLCVAFLQQQQE